MILDTVDKIGRYESISPFMTQVMKFLKETNLSDLAPGRIMLQGDDLFVNVNCQKAQSRSEVPIEVHREYIDIQIPLSGDEEMGFVSGSFLAEASVPYSYDKDVAFYPGLCDTYVNVKQGMFIVFFPGEGHAPAITEKGITKLVIKIRKSC